MRHLLDLYQYQMKTALAVQFQYRAGMVIWMLEVLLEPVVYMIVWQSAVGGGSLGGYAAADFAAYYVVLLVVSHFTAMWHMWLYEFRIREGQFNADLLRPVHPIHQDITSNIAYKLFMLVVVIPALIFFVLLFQPRLEPPLWAAALFPLAVLLAGVLNFLMGWVVAMAAFWTVRIMAINQFYFLTSLFLSGFIAPLAVLPEALQALANALPFKWTLSFPVELLLGRLSPAETLAGFGAQVAWIAAFVALLLMVWRQAVRRYGAVGG